MNKPPFILLLLAFCLKSVSAQQDSFGLQISLLTCSPGAEIYSTFGHSAIRVIDPINNKDIVYDFGVFDFDEPNFVWKFMKGDLNYRLSEKDYPRFHRSYVREKRGVVEQILNLPEEEKRKIYNALKENYLPENRYYLYDFLFDNCSTRIRDLMTNNNLVVQNHNKENADTTFRDYLNVYLVDKKWISFGIDLLLGSRVDWLVRNEQQMFLPNTLSKQLGEMIFVENGISKPILGVENRILKEVPSHKLPFFLQPFFVNAVVCFIFVLFVFWKPGIGDKLSTVAYLFFGILGIILLFMWFGTTHFSTKANWNLWWANPFYILIPLLKKKILKRYAIVVFTLLNVLLLLFWNWLPQEINTGVLPLVGMMVLLCTRQLSMKHLR